MALGTIFHMFKKMKMEHVKEWQRKCERTQIEPLDIHTACRLKKGKTTMKRWLEDRHQKAT